MSYNKLLVVIVLLGCCDARAATTSCPAFVSDGGVTHPLTDASVFDGPPSQLADVEPTDRGWDFRFYRNSPRPIFLVCKYRGSRATRTLQVAKDTATCTIGEHAGATQVVCK